MNIGKIAEYYCIIYYLLRGHRIIGRRVKTPVGEIDVLTKKNDTTYAIEVKYRSSGIDDAKIAGLKSYKRLKRAVTYLKLSQVRLLCFAVSGIRSEIYEYEDE